MKMIHSYVLFVVSICSLVFASQPHNSNNNYGPNPSSYHGGSGSSYPPPPQSQTEDERLYYEKQKQQQQQQLYQQMNKQGGSAPPPPLPPHMSSTYSYGTHPNAPNHLQHPQHNIFSSTDPSRPVGYNSGYAPIVPRPPSYDRIQPQVQESSGTGLFAKLKSSIFAAGSAISESLSGPYYDEGRPLQQQQHQQQLLPLPPPPPPVYSRPPPPHDSPLGGGGRGGPFPGYSQSPAGQRPSGLSHTGGTGQHQYGSSSQPISQEESSSSAVGGGGGVGLIDKIKTLFNAEDSSSSSSSSSSGGGGGSSYSSNSRDSQGQYVPQQPSYPPRQQQQPFNGPLGSPPHLHSYENHQPVTPKDSRGVPTDLHPANIPGFPSPQQQQYMAAGTTSSTYRDDYRGDGYGASNIDTTAIPNSPSYNYPPHMRGPASPPPPPGRSSIPGQGYDQYDNREPQLHYSNNQPPPNYPGYGQPPQMPPNYPQMPLPEPIDPISLISPDPQVFNYDGSTTSTTTHSDPSSSSCIVMISKPREFFKKKQTFTQAGANNIQVFSDFEHVFTRFLTAEGDRTLGSAELLESSGAVQRSAVDKLNKISEEFENVRHDNYCYYYY